MTSDFSVPSLTTNVFSARGGDDTMTTDIKATEKLAGQLAETLTCPPREHARLGCSTAFDLCLDAHAVACWLAWARRDDDAQAGKERT